MVLMIFFLPAMCFAEELVKYQLPAWKAKHIHDSFKADTIVKTLTRLGHEVKKKPARWARRCAIRCQNGDNFDVTVTLKLIAGKSGLRFSFQTVHQH